MTKSIITVVSLMFVVAPALAAPNMPAVLATYETLTRIEPRCSQPKAGSEIIVCGRRRADRWRVPFVGYEAGDPRNDSVTDERNRLASEPRPPCGTTAFFSTSACGKVGFTTSIGVGPGGGLNVRRLAD